MEKENLNSTEENRVESPSNASVQGASPTIAPSPDTQAAPVANAPTVAPSPDTKADPETNGHIVTNSYPSAESTTPAPDHVPEQADANNPPKAKKKAPIKLIAIIGGALVVAVAAFLVVWFTVITPENTYKSAVAAFEDKDFAECQRLLDKIPDHPKAAQLREDLIYENAVKALEDKDFTESQRLIEQIPNHSKAAKLRAEITFEQAKNYIDNNMPDEAEALLVNIPDHGGVPSLKEDITYLRAAEAVENEDYKEAEKLLAEIPDHDDPDMIRNVVIYNRALETVEEGDYVTAYEIFDELGDYEDAKEQKKILYYEAAALEYLLEYQPSLKNPSSLRVSAANFYADEENIDLIVDYTGTNTYGGTVGSYLWARWSEDGDSFYYTISHSDYADPSTEYDFYLWYIIDNIPYTSEEVEVKIDVARINRLLENKVEFKVDIGFEFENITEN